jgi:hypothetical protein
MIDAARVEELFDECYVSPAADKDKLCRHVEGIVTNADFSDERLQNHRFEIRAMLSHLPVTFKKSSGGGMSFLNMCMDDEGVQWTGLHSTMEKLFMMGKALDLADYCLPREYWEVLPGEMPYIVVVDL